MATTKRAPEASEQGQEGQSVVLIALMLVGLVAFMGLVIDGGRAYAARRQSQNASDAASFSGTQALANGTSDSDILTNVRTFAASNGAASNSDILAYYVDSSGNQVGTVGSGSIPGSAAGVRAYVTIRFQPMLITVVSGGGQLSTQTRATALSGQASSPPGLQPIGVPRCYVDPTDNACGGNQSTDEHVIVGQGAQAQSGGSSFRGILNLKDRLSGSGSQLGCGGGDKQDAAYYVSIGGYNNDCGQVLIGNQIDALTGNSNGNAGVDAYTARYGESLVGKVFYVVVYPEGTVGNGTKAKIDTIGFAAMRITDYGSNSMSAVYAGTRSFNGPISIQSCVPPGCINQLKAIQLIQ